MKFRIFGILCLFLLGVFAIGVFNSGETDTEWNQQRPRPDWRKIKGLNWTQDHEAGVVMRFQELKLLLEYHFDANRKVYNTDRIGELLCRQGTIIQVSPGERITGKEAIVAFFDKRKGQFLIIDDMRIIDVGFINRTVNGNFVDHYVKLLYFIKLVQKKGDEIIENDDYPTTMTLMHRHNCPWDG